MSAVMNDHIQEAIDRVSEWDLPPADLPQMIAETATALAGRWLDEDEVSASIHTALHG
ncbi:MAG: hypothetical protein AAF662_03130 [Pseudomonadota bacterium]